MSRTSTEKINSGLEKESLEKFLKEIKKIDSSKDALLFLNLFFSEKEIKQILRRIAGAILLGRGKKYREIKKLLKISSGTLSNTRDILAGRGYGRNPQRKRVYSMKTSKAFRKRRGPFGLKYKGVESIF